MSTNKENEGKREMEKDSEPFTITEQTIKKSDDRWYENDNFPALIVDEDGSLIVVTRYDEPHLFNDVNDYFLVEDIRLATKDESDSLFCF